ncbi:hypothetical protein CLIB1423_19S02190 [[Candida] railenensis]|uniref:J domain-containing protein n=1 Tax=[Candida] railenensis TaxID=45579 RepID=A0A9P0QSR3_9ASCO|nr:hypothetical protein CLIB1423_19S02190 [[Candida] railenensis]
MSVDSILNAEQSALNKDHEIDRILSTCRWDYFAILEIDPLKLGQDDFYDELANKVKRSYRKKTLSVHPDKVSNPKAPQAFEKLKRAELVLNSSNNNSDSSEDVDNAETKSLVNEKERLIAIYKDANETIGRKTESVSQVEVQSLVAKILEEELRSENIEKEFEQRQEAQKMKELAKIRKERELKKKMESKWEDDRDVRVKNWRDYSSKVEKKKKKVKKSKVLA